MKNSEKQTKIAIFGGSFDPPHYGHYDIVKNLEKSFDKVIVVPSYISPFKGGNGADDTASARFGLCKKLFTSEKTEVSRRDISQKGVSYSVDTAAYFAKKYRGARLYWIVGTEELPRLSDWHDIDRLKTIVEFVAVPRPTYSADAAVLKALKKRGIKVKLAKFEGLDVSSSDVKIDIAFGKANKFMPAVVAAAAAKRGLFDTYAPFVDALYTYGLSDKRIAHTYGVAIACAELAKRFGASVHDAVVAGILHDVAKELDPSEFVGKADAKGFPAPTVHAPIGAYIAVRDFGISDEIAHAIRYHATCCADPSPLDEVVYLADKTEQGRGYKEVYYFRYLCSIDKDIAMYATLTAVSEYKDITPCEYTSAAIEHYSALCEKPLPEMPARTRGKVKQASLTLPIARASSALGEHVKPSRELRKVEERSKAVRTVPETSKAVSEVKRGKLDATSKNIAEVVAAELGLHKAHDIVIIDLEGKTIVADYFVIASCSSSTAVKALSEYTEDKLTKEFGIDPSRRDVDREWAALDYGGVIVHIFTDKTREFYNLERLWSDGKNTVVYDD